MSAIYREPLKIIRDILIEEMDLNQNQILFANQKLSVPTMGFYIVLAYVGPNKVIGRMSELVPDGAGGMLELQSVTVLHCNQIDCMAYNDPEGGNQARERFMEIQMALGSIYSEQLQSQYQMQIARNVGPFMDVSFLEATEMVTRYVTRVMTTSTKQKQASTNDYYSDFTRAVPPLLTVNA